MIFKGNTIVKSLYKGDTMIPLVYKGNTQIYPDGAAYSVVCPRTQYSGTNKNYLGIVGSGYSELLYNGYLMVSGYYYILTLSYPTPTVNFPCDGTNPRYGWTRVHPSYAIGQTGAVQNTSGASRNVSLMCTCKWNNTAASGKYVNFLMIMKDDNGFYALAGYNKYISTGINYISFQTAYATVPANAYVVPFNVNNLATTDFISEVAYQLIVAGY